MNLPGQVPEVPDNTTIPGKGDGLNDLSEQKTSLHTLIHPHRKLFGERLSTNIEAAPYKRPRTHIVDSNAFQLVVLLIITLNALSIGIETDYGCRGVCTVPQRGQWYILDCIFTAVFTLEMAMRFHAHGVLGYFIDNWNRFDFVLVVVAFVDTTILSHLDFTGVDLRFFSTLRIVRIFRLVRLVRLVRMFDDVRLITHSIIGSLKTVGRVFFVLLAILWCLAIFMTIVVGQDEDPQGYDYDHVPWTREQYWGTVNRSVFSLFQFVTSDGWESSLASPVLAKYPHMIIVFVLAMGLCAFGLVNIIVAVIVNSTLSSASRSKRKIGQMLEKSLQRANNTLGTIFFTCSNDPRGMMNHRSFIKTLRQNRTKGLLALMGLPEKDIRELFALLDADGKGKVAVDEFQQLCLMLKGPAMSKDMTLLTSYIKDVNAYVDDMTQSVDEQSSVLQCVMDCLLRIEHRWNLDGTKRRRAGTTKRKATDKRAGTTSNKAVDQATGDTDAGLQAETHAWSRPPVKNAWN